ncbi:MAG: molybdopterin-synthase adenylyltransferase MoeB [Candidatus Eisenbacteria bacterium]
MNGRLCSLSKAEVLRYSRHLVLPEVTRKGQERLKAGRVLLVGAGGLGSPLALYLAAAGVGRIGIVDYDTVDESNLQRQVIHGTSDVGRLKTSSAIDRLKDLNPHVETVAHDGPLTAANGMEVLVGYDVIADGSDNFPTRYLVNDACVFLGKPNVHGSVFRFEGQATVFDARVGPCYRCLYPEPPTPGLTPSCAAGGVLGVVPGIIGLIQATETLKILLGAGETLAGRLLLYDALRMTFREMKLRKDPGCPVCGKDPAVRELIDYEAFCGFPGSGPGGATEESHRRRVSELVDRAAGTGRGAERRAPVGSMEPRTLKEKLDAGDGVVVLDVREPLESQIGAIPGAVVIPIGEIPERFHEIDRSKEIVCVCRTGIRSLHAAMFLTYQGYGRVYNLVGGIHAWAEEVDPSIPKY